MEDIMFSVLDASIILGIIIGALVIMLIVYLLNGFGYMKLFKATGVSPPWAAFVPFYGRYKIAEFLVLTIGDPIWEVWLLAFYVFAILIPGVGGFIVTIGNFAVIYARLKWIHTIGASPLLFLLVFVCPVALPFIIAGYYKQ